MPAAASSSLKGAAAQGDRATLTMSLADGRILGYGEYGAPDGAPVLGFHGTPGSRLMFRIAHRPALEAGVRLIAPDRPGFGVSSPHPGRSLASCAFDMAEFADRLGLSRFAVAGVSGGGPYAAACAAFLRERISALALVSPVGPMCRPEMTQKIGPGHYFAFQVMPRVPPLSALVCGAGRAAFLHAPALIYAFLLRRASQADRRVLSRQDVRRNLLEGVAEGCRPGLGATMQELAIFARPWNVPFRDITAAATLWQGLSDRNVPVSAALRLGALIPGCRVETIPDAGHYWIFENMSAVLGAVSDAAHQQSDATASGRDGDAEI